MDYLAGNVQLVIAIFEVDSSQKSDKERIKELEAENARLKYEISFYDDFMKEMREIAKPNRAVKKKHKQLPSKD